MYQQITIFIQINKNIYFSKSNIRFRKKVVFFYLDFYMKLNIYTSQFKQHYELFKQNPLYFLSDLYFVISFYIPSVSLINTIQDCLQQTILLAKKKSIIRNISICKVQYINKIKFIGLDANTKKYQSWSFVFCKIKHGQSCSNVAM